MGSGGSGEAAVDGVEQSLEGGGAQVGLRAPEVRAAVEDAFMAGLGAASVVIGLLCLAGAVLTLVALPGNRFVPPTAVEEETSRPVRV